MKNFDWKTWESLYPLTREHKEGLGGLPDGVEFNRAGQRVFLTMDELEEVVTFAQALKEHTRLLKRLQSARNYSYEATMGDYSMDSINRAQAQVTEAKQALEDAGYEVPTW